jgi:delta14-sterol reductase/lamin-B receptor
MFLRYVSSFIPKGKILAKGGNTGSVVYDFFIGRELNPRIGSIDLKEFCELRPGLIGWAVLNLGMAYKQYQKRLIMTGSGSISLSMFFITLLQGFYVWDALYMEKAILTTMDITTDGFGFMLCFGDLSWVPFIYSLQARYLVDYDPELSLLQVLVILAVYALGFYIFRSANSEKDAFRKDPDSPEVRHLKFMPTKRGTKLLVSGWWGLARKINYTGDWLITLSWCLLCGFRSPIPYFQAIYFMILLIHR